MIAHLRGKLIDIHMDSVTIDCGGVGYEALCTTEDIQSLLDKKDQEVSLWIYCHVREEALQLFGFLQKESKSLFLSLLKVNGIGPKSALNILGGASLLQIFQFIEQGDAKALSRLPKIGKKTAEQIVLTLQGKLVRVEEKPTVKKHSEIHFALVNLGFKPQIVSEFVETLDESIEIEEGIRRGLSSLAKQI